MVLYADAIRRDACPTLTDLPSIGDEAGSACILTSDDQLAARLRNIRSSYGAGPPVAVVRTANGRLSEAQAAMALLSLQRIGTEPTELELCRSALPGRHVLPFGRAAAIVATDAHERDHFLGALAMAGLPGSALALDGRARHCTSAVGIAARTVTVPLGALADAVQIWRGC